MTSNINILIVEDEKNVAFLISHMLKNLNYNVAGVASSYAEALKLIESCKPDLILTDIKIEGEKDGIDTALEIKKNFGIPAIFITAYSDNETVERAKEADPFGYLLKPFEIKDLKSTLEIAIKKIEYENKLKESELWFRSTLNSIGDGIIATDKFDNIKFINEAAEKLIGCTSDECMGKKLGDVYKTSPDISTEGLVYLSSAGKQNFREVFLNNKLLTTREGKNIPVEEKLSSIKMCPDETIGKVITFKDVTLKREAELKALSAKDFYLDVIEKFPVMVWRANNEGYFNYFNSCWLEFTGGSIDSEIYDRWYSNIHPADRQSFIDLYESSFKKRSGFEIEIRLMSKEKEYHWLICFGNPLFDLKGNFDGYIGVCLDITNRKILEEQLMQEKNASESSSKAKSFFISNISHEIRTPLNGIMGLADLLFETKLDGEQFEFLTLVKQSSRTLLNLLNNLLDYSKIEDNKETLNEESFNLRYTIKEILSPFQSVAKRNGVLIEYEVDKSIPLKLIGDGGKVHQVLANLVSNAFKFTAKGSVRLQCKIDKTTGIHEEGMQGLLVHFSVSDTGIGIPDEKQNIVFESFTQVDGSLTKKYSGSGLGLAIVKRLVEIMNGEIWFESETGKGSTFHFVVELKRKVPNHKTIEADAK